MSVTVYPAKVDANQPDIVEALRKAGATVQHLHTIGKGCPDLLVGYQGNNYVLEIKNGKGKLTADEAAWLNKWQGRAHIVRTADEALQAIGALA